MLPWIDLETSGLSPIGCCPLELAILITTDDLEVVDHHVWLIKPTFDPDTWGDFVREMHTKNGLIKDLGSGGARPVIEVEAEACKFLRQNGIDGIPVCGSTIGFDRRFLEQWMPAVDKMFHYRSIDVSSTKEQVKLWAPEHAYPPVPDDQKAHRALADVYASVEEAKWYRNIIIAGAAALLPL